MSRKSVAKPYTLLKHAKYHINGYQREVANTPLTKLLEIENLGVRCFDTIMDSVSDNFYPKSEIEELENYLLNLPQAHPFNIGIVEALRNAYFITNIDGSVYITRKLSVMYDLCQELRSHKYSFAEALRSVTPSIIDYDCYINNQTFDISINLEPYEEV